MCAYVINSTTYIYIERIVLLYVQYNNNFDTQFEISRMRRKKNNSIFVTTSIEHAKSKDNSFKISKVAIILLFFMNFCTRFVAQLFLLFNYLFNRYLFTNHIFILVCFFVGCLQKQNSLVSKIPSCEIFVFVCFHFKFIKLGDGAICAAKEKKTYIGHAYPEK